MRIRSAIEVMKMLGPIAPEFTKEKTTLKIMTAIINHIQEVHPPAAVRLLALMEGKTLEQLAEEFSETRDGRELINRLVEGFRRNDLAFMMDFASLIGLSDARFGDG